MVLALAVSDEADDHGRVFQAMDRLAKKTRLSERSVRRHMAALEKSGLLVCLERSPGGRGQFNRYQFNLPIFLEARNPDTVTGLGVQNPDTVTGFTPRFCQGFDLLNPDTVTGLGDLSDAPIYKDLKKDVGGIAAFDRVDEVEDHRLAAWMFDRIKAINPQHKEPPWATWRKHIRLMRERDKKTPRDIALLFAWANAHPFWQANILSPATLRKQWDKLFMQRAASGGAGAATVAPDRSCSWNKGGVKCTAVGVITRPDGTRFCRPHDQEDERERAGAQT